MKRLQINRTLLPDDDLDALTWFSFWYYINLDWVRLLEDVYNLTSCMSCLLPIAWHDANQLFRCNLRFKGYDLTV